MPEITPDEGQKGRAIIGDVENGGEKVGVSEEGDETDGLMANDESVAENIVDLTAKLNKNHTRYAADSSCL